MAKIDYTNDVTSAEEIAKGSDGRLNVSSRADGRGYYNSRDLSESYTLTFNDANATTGDYVVYLRNDKTDGKHMVIRSISVNGEVLSAFDLVTVTGTAGGGAAAAPVNMNQAGVAKSATTTALTTADSGSTPMSGLSTQFELDHLQVMAGGHGEFLLQDQVRIGQKQSY